MLKCSTLVDGVVNTSQCTTQISNQQRFALKSELPVDSLPPQNLRLTNLCKQTNRQKIGDSITVMARKNITVEVRNGLKFPFSVPADIETFNEDAKDRPPDAWNLAPVLSDAIDNNLYRGGLPSVWARLAEAIFAEYKVARLTKPHPNKEKAAKGETVDGETDPHYVDRVAVVAGIDLDTPEGLKTFQAFVDKLGITTLDLSIVKGEGKGLIGKGDLDMAKVYMDAGHDKLQKALKKLSQMTGEEVPKLTGDASADQKTIALMIKAGRAAFAKGLIS